MIRTLVVALSVGSVSVLVGACHRHAREPRGPAETRYYAPSDPDRETDDPPQQQQQQQQQAQQTFQQQPQPATGCDRACGHYLQCRGWNDSRSFGACVQQCNKMRFSEIDLANYQRTDCVTAIQIVEGKPQQAQQQQQKSSECNGCVWDGSSCVWISQSNWGTGPNNPYSGAVSSCSSYCCGH